MIKELIIQYPHIAIILFAILISFFISVVNYFVMDKERMAHIKKRQKEIQEEMKNHKGNPQKLAELQKEMFSFMGETFKQSFKPMLITFIPLILIFPLMRNLLATSSIASTWFWWYLGASIASSMIFRKLLKLP